MIGLAMSEPPQGKPDGKVDRARYPLRMKDLCERTGLDRQTIHFYIQQGLVPEGFKTGRNMAYYGDEHVERIELVRKLQRERFLPLKAIKALLEGRDEAFTPDQRALLVGVSGRLGDLRRELGDDDAGATVEVGELLKAHHVSRAELREMEDLGLLSTVRQDGREVVRQADAWPVEIWGNLRATGFASDLGFTVADLGRIEELVSALFDYEVKLITPRLTSLPAERIADMVQKGLPLINEFLTRYHLTKVRNFLAAMGLEGEPAPTSKESGEE